MLIISSFQPLRCHKETFPPQDPSNGVTPCILIVSCLRLGLPLTGLRERKSEVNLLLRNNALKLSNTLFKTPVTVIKVGETSLRIWRQFNLLI